MNFVKIKGQLFNLKSIEYIATENKQKTRNVFFVSGSSLFLDTKTANELEAACMQAHDAKIYQEGIYTEFTAKNSALVDIALEQEKSKLQAIWQPDEELNIAKLNAEMFNELGVSLQFQEKLDKLVQELETKMDAKASTTENVENTETVGKITKKITKKTEN